MLRGRQRFLTVNADAAAGRIMKIVEAEKEASDGAFASASRAHKRHCFSCWDLFHMQRQIRSTRMSLVQSASLATDICRRARDSSFAQHRLPHALTHTFIFHSAPLNPLNTSIPSWPLGQGLGKKCRKAPFANTSQSEHSAVPRMKGQRGQ